MLPSRAAGVRGAAPAVFSSSGECPPRSRESTGVTRLASLRDRAALVTGASSGIGRALALRLAAGGARIALVARRAEALERVASEIAEAGGEAFALPCDVADREAAGRCAAEALERLGTVDLLVNNAGYGHHARFLDWDLDDMERMMRVNYFGTLYFTKALLPDMVAQRRGWIVMLSSIAGRLATPGESAYAASKFAQRALGQALGLEVEAAGVHVLNVYPGVVDTPFYAGEARSQLPEVARRSMVDSEELVDAILGALRRGRRELIYPRWLGAGVVTEALAPGLVRSGMRRTALRALDE